MVQVQGSLGGPWVVIIGVINPLIRVISKVTLLITPLITTHEPPSRALGFLGFRVQGCGYKEMLVQGSGFWV